MEKKAERKTKQTELDKLPFEDAVAELERVAKRLESGEGTLDEMIALYERGMLLANVCNKRLDAYEAKITKLSALHEEADHDD